MIKDFYRVANLKEDGLIQGKRGMSEKRKIIGLCLIIMFTIIAIGYGFQGIRSSYRLYPAILGYSRAFPMWFGMEAVVTRNMDPYSQQGQAVMEEAFFGRALEPGEEVLVRDRQHFVYPLYVVLVYLPTLYLSVENAMTVLWVAGFLMTVAAVVLWSRMIWPKGDALYSIGVIALFLSWPHVYLTLQSRQPQILVLFFITLAVYLISHEGRGIIQIISGMLLFLSTIKPQSSLIAILYILGVWLPSMGNRRATYLVYLGFLVMCVFCLVTTIGLVPGWIGEFLRAIGRYREYAGGTGTESLWGNGILSVGMSALFVVTGIIISMVSYRKRQSHLHIIVLCYLLVMQGLVFPSHSYVMVMGLPAFVLTSYTGLMALKQGKRFQAGSLLVFLLATVFAIHTLWFSIISEGELPGNLVTKLLTFKDMLPKTRLFSPLVLMLITTVSIFLIRVSERIRVGSEQRCD